MESTESALNCMEKNEKDKNRGMKLTEGVTKNAKAASKDLWIINCYREVFTKLSLRYLLNVKKLLEGEKNDDRIKSLVMGEKYWKIFYNKNLGLSAY